MLSVEVSEVLDDYPDVRNALDENALSKLARADVERAVEIISEIGTKGDVRNPSAFVASSLAKFPRKRGRPEDLDAVLAAHPEIELDEAAHEKLRSAELGRAVEIIEEIALKGDVRNPSAFISNALSRFPHKRGNIDDKHPPAYQRSDSRISYTYAAPEVVRWIPPEVVRRVPIKYPSSLDTMLASHPEIVLDDAALDHLYAVPSDRAVEIIQDIIAKGDVRNPSAFVSQALRAHPEKRGGQTDLERTLAKYRGVAQALDDEALDQLRRAEPARAVEIIEDVATKSNVRNLSAFIAKALTSHPQKRGHEEMDAWSPHPIAYPMVAWGPHPMMAWSPQRQPPLMNPKRFRAEPGLRDIRYVRDELDDVRDELDDEARRRLDEADPARAHEILQELSDKGSEIRNPSAFVARALQQYPHERGRRY